MSTVIEILGFKGMLADAEKPLYPGAKHSKLFGLMRLYNVKRNYRWLIKVFNFVRSPC